LFIDLAHIELGAVSTGKRIFFTFLSGLATDLHGHSMTAVIPNVKKPENILDFSASSHRVRVSN
jgi:hypothetical protein